MNEWWTGLQYCIHSYDLCHWCLWCVRNIPGTTLGCLYKYFPILTADLRADVSCPVGTWHSWDLKPGLWLHQTSRLYGQFSKWPRATLWGPVNTQGPDNHSPVGGWEGSQERKFLWSNQYQELQGGMLLPHPASFQKQPRKEESTCSAY